MNILEAAKYFYLHAEHGTYPVSYLHKLNRYHCAECNATSDTLNIDHNQNCKFVEALKTIGY